MLNLEETITKLQNFSDKFTEDIELCDGENKGKPHEYLDTFVDYDMIEAALHHVTEQNKLLNTIAHKMHESQLEAYPNVYLEIEDLILGRKT